MRIGLHHQSLGLGPYLISAELSPGDEELLFRRESVEIRRTLPGNRFFVSQECNLRTAQVANAFAQNELPVVVNILFDIVVIELICHASRSPLKSFQIFLRPPVPQPSQKIELCALVVEAV